MKYCPYFLESLLVSYLIQAHNSKGDLKGIILSSVLQAAPRMEA